ncbi:MAG: hypothetical protein NTW83_06600 [Cyanobacteria bacterium]|nr:hypothetical protein [Cyanobacteriota bacterium]
MTRKADPSTSRTPISDGLASDLQALGSLLGSHMRGLDEHLGRQHERLSLREDQLIEESRELLPPAPLELDHLSKEQLQGLCRQHKLKGWSKLRRDPLLAFVAAALAQASAHSSGSPTPLEASLSPAAISRIERLLLLLLQHLAVSPEQIQEAWDAPLDSPVGWTP